MSDATRDIPPNDIARNEDDLARELHRLVAAQLSGESTRDESARLDTLVHTNPAARRIYVELVHESAALHWLVDGENAKGVSELRVGRQESEVGSQESEEREQATEPAGRARKEGEGGSCETEGRGQEKELSAISSGPSATSKTLVSRLTPHHSKKSWLDRASRRPVRPALAIAALVMISVVAWMGVTMVKTQIAGGGRKSTDEHQESAKPEFVAWLMKAHKTQWLDGTEPEHTRLMPGQRLAISKGLIEIQYRTRAVVVIEGPAEFYVGARDSGLGAKKKYAQTSAPSPQPLDPKSLANRGFLKHGKLVARVEGEKAEGFTIDTPSASVEDFGTEFGVEVWEDGAAEFVVLTGEVDVIRETMGDSPRQRMRLTKDQGAFVAAGGGAITRRAKVDAQIVAAMRKRLDEPLVVRETEPNGLVVNASFELPRLGTGEKIHSGSFKAWRVEGRGGIYFVSLYPAYGKGSAICGLAGQQAAFLTEVGGNLSQELSLRVQAGHRYELTVAVGVRGSRAQYPFGGYRVEFLAGDVVVASKASTSPPGPADGFTDVKILFQPEAESEHIDQPLSIRLSLEGSAERRSVDFDNVRLRVISPDEQPNRKPKPVRS